MLTRRLFAMTLTLLAVSGGLSADDFQLTLRSLKPGPDRDSLPVPVSREERWRPEETAVIVCDTWDLHHCLNAVRRLEEFAPRLNDLLTEARRRGATIIHAPSDCMPAYVGHPARVRAEQAPRAENAPRDIVHWCSRIPSEEQAIYPIDQSDGGEDDDPREHAAWAEKLKSLGRNPGTPWKTQSALITIDEARDYISDRGDEVWNILQQRKIRHVLLTGVHTNMCVLGRPFGLRQLARGGLEVALVRDLTDSMYNPKRWPYVDHFTGHDLVLAHVEQTVCPTITSDQILGGERFRWKGDQRAEKDVVRATGTTRVDRATFEKQWSLGELPLDWKRWTGGTFEDYRGVAWYRCTVLVPREWGERGLTLELQPAGARSVQAWLNGTSLGPAAAEGALYQGTIPAASLALDDANLLVLRIEQAGASGDWKQLPELKGTGGSLVLKGRWQFRLGDDPAWSNIPLPARFGGAPDMLFEPTFLKKK